MSLSLPISFLICNYLVYLDFECIYRMTLCIHGSSLAHLGRIRKCPPGDFALLTMIIYSVGSLWAMIFSFGGVVFEIPRLRNAYRNSDRELANFRPVPFAMRSFFFDRNWCPRAMRRWTTTVYKYFERLMSNSVLTINSSAIPLFSAWFLMKTPSA